MPAGFVLAGSLLLYGFTAMRSPGWLDATLILSIARNLPLGVWVNTHNLFSLAGHAWMAMLRFLDPHFALTLLSVLFGSLTVLLVYSAGRELTGSRLASAIGAAGLALSHSLWWHSTMIEVYTLNSALIALTLFLVFRYFRAGGFGHLVVAFFAAGLGVFNHVLMALFVPALAALVVYLAVRRPGIAWWKAAILVLAYAAGAAPYAVLFLQQYSWLAGGLLPLDVNAFTSTLAYATGTQTFGSFLFPTGLAAGQKLFWRLNYLFLIAWNFPSAAFGLAAWGLWRFWRMKARRGCFLFFGVGIAAQIIWSANYLIWDMYAFSLPVYVMLGVPLILGVDALLAAGRDRVRIPVLATLVFPVLLYTGISWLPGFHALMSRYTSLYRETAYVSDLWDPAVYVMNPARPGYREAEKYCTALMKRLPRGSHFWDNDARADYPLRFYYVEALGRKLGFTLHSQFGLTVTPESVLEDAQAMLRALHAGFPVFVSTLGFPERAVLDQLWLLIDPGASADDVRELSLTEFRARMPFRIEEVHIEPDRSWVVYRLRLGE
ncbi:MAG: DUF2723 domain-containing protein [Spirochaetes bacterium]|nr:DUF2723 domain-containing protein [Spirochaetota bacterium]